MTVLSVNYPIDLQNLHSFATPAKAAALYRFDQHSSVAELQARLQEQPWLILGGGTNLLFVDDFPGLIIQNAFTGRQYREVADAVELELAAGENWNQSVWHSLEQGLWGLENLVEIPGSVGAGPVQNIGAYGVELADVLLWVQVIDLQSGQQFRLTAAECQFGYRDSCFKRQPHWLITRLCLRLQRHGSLKLSYGTLAQRHADKASTPLALAATIAELRWQKLPRPADWGNAGSFFKNPLVAAELGLELQRQFPSLPCYRQAEGGFKLAAGWLIEQAGLKGFQLGAAAVYEHQALVLINRGGATGRDIWTLAQYVQKRVLERFGVQLEPEVRCVGLES